MRIEIDAQAWNRGFWDGELGKPLDCCPYAVKAAESLSWLSGYIEGKAFRNASEPPRPAPWSRGKKCAPPLSPTLFRFASQLRTQRRNIAARWGSKLDADWGSKFGAD
jgi:ribosome modulation factor